MNVRSQGRCAMVAGLLALIAMGSAAQPKDGDLIFTAWGTGFANGFLCALDPTTQTVTTIAGVTGDHFYQVDMAADNTAMIVSQSRSSLGTSDLVSYSPNGVGTTLAPNLPGWITAMDLDGDDHWIASDTTGGLLSVNRVSGQHSTLVSAGTNTYHGVSIVREGNAHYALGNLFGSTSVPSVYNADRTGIIGTVFMATTISPSLYDVNLAPTTGRLMISDFTNGLVEVTSPNTSTLFATFGDAEGARGYQDNTFYVIGNTSINSVTENTIQQFDLKARTILNTWRLTQVPWANFTTYGIVRYGSRVVTCLGTPQPGGQVQISIKTHNASSLGANYQLAMSTGRRPGVLVPGGERLMLNVTDPLFQLTAQNLLPGIAVNFSGTIAASGRAAATVNIPRSFPPNLGLTIFVGGIIYTTSSVVQVTNVHWFEL